MSRLKKSNKGNSKKKENIDRSTHKKARHIKSKVHNLTVLSEYIPVATAVN
jgi:exonuclease III